MTAYLPPFIALLVSIGIFVAYINPTYTKNIAGLNTEIENYDSALVAATDYLEKQAEITEKRSALSEEDVRRLKAFLPDGVDNVQLIVDLTSLAAKSNIILSDIDVKAAGSNAGPSRAPVEGGLVDRGGITVGEQGPIDSVDLSLKFTASYDRLIGFLSAIESSLRPLDVTALSFQTSELGSPVITMTLRVYWLR